MPSPSPDIEALKRASLGQLLFRTARLFNETAIARVQRKHPHVRLAHTQLLPHLDGVGQRATTLAAKVGISKQAIGELLADMLASGILEQVRDPNDGRARLVRFTPAGYDAMRDGLGVLTEVAAELESAVGRDTLDRLHVDLSKVLAAFEQHRD